MNTSPLIFTENAALKVKSLIAEEGNQELNFRAYISGGGCSGFQYGFTFDEQINEDDFVIEKEGVKLLVDAMSFQYLQGAEIDYVSTVEGEHFVIRNPNAKTTCGCGNSFSTGDEDEMDEEELDGSDEE
ncbi:MAG: iron-sulfur cluster insertion protein ErpA [Gammaproteobacteria bacterium]|nr:iron-sulfur cluster insertion protein ErpA [Gammaproteobacteria bacterium]